jgi:lipoic acid synthetase
LGKLCSRKCSFCGIRGGTPGGEVDQGEPERIARAVKKLGMKHVVITSVTRDDLPDGGLSQFLSTFSAIKNLKLPIQLEFLIPDFIGSSLQQIAELEINILTHNLETVSRLYPSTRPQFNYRRSLSVLEIAKKINPKLSTKSGIMLGLGESKKEVLHVMRDLISVGCEILTIGQYLPPSKRHPPPTSYIHPQLFKEYEEIGKDMGFHNVTSGPFVRSSYLSHSL